jgi:hypothetical protein
MGEMVLFSNIHCHCVKSRIFILIVAIACPTAILIFLLIGWRASWLGWAALDEGDGWLHSHAARIMAYWCSSPPWMLAAAALSAGCILVAGCLARKSAGASSRQKPSYSVIATAAADKLRLAMVAVGILWMLWLGFSVMNALRMNKTTGVVERIENGRADVIFNLPSGGGKGGHDFPAFDGLSSLKVGESLEILNEGKTTEIAGRTWVFAALGGVNGALLILGGLFCTKTNCWPWCRGR